VEWTEESVFDEIRAVISKHKIKDPNEIHRHSNLFEELAFDSLDVLDLQAELSERFALDLSDDDGSNKFTVQDILNSVVAALERKQSNPDTSEALAGA